LKTGANKCENVRRHGTFSGSVSTAEIIHRRTK